MTQTLKNKYGKSLNEMNNFFDTQYGGKAYLTIVSILLTFSFVYYILLSSVTSDTFNFWYIMKDVAFEILLGLTFSSLSFSFMVKFSKKKDSYSKFQKTTIALFYLTLSLLFSLIISFVYFMPFAFFGMGGGGI